jgi:ribosomal protein S18 acetylase RimI-like enzyme
MAVQQRPYRGQPADDLLIADLLDAQPGHARHLADQPWRLSSPDAQSGRYARLWQEPGGQLAGFAAWQAPWAALDLYVRDGPHRATVTDAIFGWADSLFRELDDERGFALPYWLECRTGDPDTPALAAARGFTLSEPRYAGLERPLGAGTAHAHPVPSGVRPGCTGMGLAQALLTELSGRLAAAGAERVCVEADQANAAALRSYAAAGFRVTHAVRALGRTLGPPDQAGRR